MVDAQAQESGFLPAAAAALPFGSQVEFTYRDGRTVRGIIKDTQGATWGGLQRRRDDPAFYPVE